MDIYVIFEGNMAFDSNTSPTDIVFFYGFRWIPTTGGSESKEGRVISVAASADAAVWKQAILDDIADWATTNEYTIVRLIFHEFSAPVV